MEDWQKHYIEQLQIASDALQSAHNILVENEIDIREPKVKVGQWEKIQIPRGHIRKVPEFIGKYDLNCLLSEVNLQKNIAYSLQTSDFITLLLNRFNISLSVGSIFYKLSIINIFCVVEALVYGIIDDLHAYCKTGEEICKNNRACQYYIKSIKKLKFNTVVDLLIGKQILNLKTEDRKLLFEYNDLRNNVHIFLSKDNEFLSQKYNRKAYNRLVFILRRMSKNLCINLNSFEDGRSIHCNSVT